LQRILSTAVLVGLLAATAAAFAITERLKLTKSPITGTRVVRADVSPAAHSSAAINVRFRRADHVTVTIRSSNGSEVDTLVFRKRLPAGRRTFVWNGLTDAGTPAPDGTYRMEIHLANQRRTILLPNPLAVDTTRPAVVDAGAVRPLFSPDGDHQADTVTIHYKLSEPAHVVVSLRGRQIIRGRSHLTRAKVSWGGKVNGRLLPPGTYLLTVGAVDLAGNRASKVQHVAVHLRYISLAAFRIVANPGARLRVGVSTDAKRYHWSIGARSGIATRRVLTLRAPAVAGTYVLTVSEHGRLDRASVVVR
jgi:FlgD Ig-like domain